MAYELTATGSVGTSYAFNFTHPEFNTPVVSTALGGAVVLNSDRKNSLGLSAQAIADFSLPGNNAPQKSKTSLSLGLGVFKILDGIYSAVGGQVTGGASSLDDNMAPKLGVHAYFNSAYLLGARVDLRGEYVIRPGNQSNEVIAHLGAGFTFNDTGVIAYLGSL